MSWIFLVANTAVCVAEVLVGFESWDPSLVAGLADSGHRWNYIPYLMTRSWRPVWESCGLCVLLQWTILATHRLHTHPMLIPINNFNNLLKISWVCSKVSNVQICMCVCVCVCVCVCGLWSFYTLIPKPLPDISMCYLFWARRGNILTVDGCHVWRPER